VTKQADGGAAHRQAADLARQWVTRAVLGIVRESGAQLVHRSVFRDRPDLNLKVTGAEPMAGLRAATALKMATRRLLLDYVRDAREDGYSWRDVGVGLGYSDDSESGVSAAVAAYDFAAGTTSGWRLFAWTCQHCHATIIDRGPEAGHPADCEDGHADDCARLTAAVAAWNASWDDKADL
jgi:hypothetical protein